MRILAALLLGFASVALPCYALDETAAHSEAPAANEICTGKAANRQVRLVHEQNKFVLVGSRKRSYHVHIPEGYKGSPLPLVIVLHGGLGNQLVARWDSKMSSKADADGFFAVYPNGTGRQGSPLLTWNVGQCCGIASRNQVNDILFLRKVIEKMRADYQIDPDRIYIAGISNGGMLAYEAGREMGDVLAAVAPVAGCMFDTTTPARAPVSVIAFHGTRDNVIPYNGGVGSVFGYKIHSLPVSAAIEFWSRNDRCSGAPVIEKSSAVVRETYEHGANGTEVRLCTVLDEPHAWSGGRAAWPPWRVPSHRFSTTDEMCDFFWKHPRLHGEAAPSPAP